MQAGEVDADGVSVPAGELTLVSNTTLQDRFGRDVSLEHGPYGPFAGHQVNPPPVTITNIEVAYDPPDRGFYTADPLESEIYFRVTFSDEVTWGSPEAANLTVLVGDTETTAYGTDRVRNTTVDFIYTVQAGEVDTDGVSVPAGELTLVSNTTLQDCFGRDVSLGHGAYGPFADHRVNPPDGPPGPSVALTSDANADNRDGDDDTYAIGDEVQATVTFDADVTVTGAPQLTLNVGRQNRTAAYDTGESTTPQLVFSWTVAEGDADTDGIEIAANSLLRGLAYAH